MSDNRDGNALDATPNAAHDDAARALPPVPPLPSAAQAAPPIPVAAPAEPVANPFAPLTATTHASAPAQNLVPESAPEPALTALTALTAPAVPLGNGFRAQQFAGHAFDERLGGSAFGQGSAPAAHAQGPAPQAPAKRSRGGMLVGALLAAALVGGAAGFGGSWAGNALFGAHGSTNASGAATVTINNPDKVNAVSAVANKVTPSVVTIEASSTQSGGSGSGVVLSTDGYVLTNTHVVTLDGASGNATLRATDSNGKIYEAEIVGIDPLYDLAVIKLKGASGLTPMEFADSDSLNVGDSTVAIGAPLGLPNTVTTGIVSYLNRSIQIASSAVPNDGSTQDNSDGQFEFDTPGQDQKSQGSGSISIAVIQTDAAINPGNSGGALVNAEGQLIGINVAIASAGSGSGQSGNIGVGFSIPSNIAKRVSDEIIADGAATHGLLGATVVSASALQGATIEGAAIREISAGGAAEKAGLKAGDIVTGFDGKPITSSIDLTAQVRALAGGSSAEVTFVRDGKTESVTVTLGTYK